MPIYDRPQDGAHPSPLGDQLVVGHELPIVVGKLVRRERLEAFGRAARRRSRERAEAALLLLGQEPCEIELRGIGMRRILEVATRERIGSDDILARGNATGDRKMALDPVRLGSHGSERQKAEVM